MYGRRGKLKLTAREARSGGDPVIYEQKRKEPGNFTQSALEEKQKERVALRPVLEFRKDRSLAKVFS